MSFGQPHWSIPLERLSCKSNEVHVWRANLQGLVSQLTTLVRILNTEEIARANRFARETDRDRYIACRAGLRMILTRYLGVSTAALVFRLNVNGKPRLHNELGAVDLRFSVSYTEGLALYSVSCGRETGVDVEWVRSSLASPWIAERFFLAEEAKWLGQLGGDSYVEGFFQCWTRMEAYLKACGQGLAGAGTDSSEDRSDWSIYDLQPGTGYAGALAAGGQGHRIICWDLPL